MPFERDLVPVREAVAPLIERLVVQGRVRPIPTDVMVYAVVAMNSVNAEVPFVSLLGGTFAADPGGSTCMRPRTFTTPGAQDLAGEVDRVAGAGAVPKVRRRPRARCVEQQVESDLELPAVTVTVGS